MQLPEAAFLFFPGLIPQIICGPMSHWGRKRERDGSSPSWGHSSDPDSPAYSALALGAVEEGRPKLLARPAENCTYTGQKTRGPFLFQNISLFFLLIFSSGP